MTPDFIHRSAQGTLLAQLDSLGVKIIEGYEHSDTDRSWAYTEKHIVGGAVLTEAELRCAEFGQTYNEMLDMFGISDADPRRELADKLDGYSR